MNTRALLLSAIVGLAVMTPGCDWYDDDTKVVTSTTNWLWDADLHHETDEDNFLWDTTLDQADVGVRLRDYYGLFRIRIYDDLGAKIFDQEYDNYHYSEDDLFLGATQLGAAGTWRIRIDLWDFDGEARVELSQP
ncbi:MAG: hypothetical protein AAF581_04160 [Planctomycetota bacterium]